MRQLVIYLPSGRIWKQTGVVYATVEDVKAVWDKIGPYLPPGTEATAVERGGLKHGSSNGH